MQPVTTVLVPIGRFARVTGLTVKALRHYDETGLLRPARVDQRTGYRYYALGQARTAEAIRRLRTLEVPLDDVRELLDADPDTLRERLAAHRARIEGRAVETRRILTELGRLIEGKEPLVPTGEDIRVRFEMEVKRVPAERVAVVRERAHQERLPEVIPRQIDEVGDHLKRVGAKPVGPPFCVCPFPDADGMLEVETGWPVAEDVPGGGAVEVKTYPEARAFVCRHVGAYEELARSYRLMAEVMEDQGLESVGAPREIYWTDPDEVPDPNDYVTEIVWPVGPEGGLDPSRDVFRRRVEPAR